MDEGDSIAAAIRRQVAWIALAQKQREESGDNESADLEIREATQNLLALSLEVEHCEDELARSEAGEREPREATGEEPAPASSARPSSPAVQKDPVHARLQAFEDEMRDALDGMHDMLVGIAAHANGDRVTAMRDAADSYYARGMKACRDLLADVLVGPPTETA